MRVALLADMHGNAVAFRAALADLEGRTPPDEVSVAGDVTAAGHVHLQWLRRFGPALWLSVGSVGLVYEHREPLDDVPFEPWSEYALLTAEDGRLDVQFRRVAFDVEELVAAARAAGFPGADTWARMWKR